MKTVSLVEFRQRAQSVLSAVKKGQSVLLTYRGKPVARLEPVTRPSAGDDDPFYSLDRLAEQHRLAEEGGKSLTNDEMDRLIYGS